jgi:hypothetical protein
MHRLLVGYGEALDSLAAKSAIVFLSHRSVPQRWSRWRILLPRANFTAKILAEAHVAARVDALIRRGQRFRALDPRGHSPLDVDCLQNFRNSLSPVTRRTLTLWVVLAALAVAFPVAVIADYLRALAPEAIVCSSRFSFRYIIAKFNGTTPQPVTTSCRVRHTGWSLSETLLRVAHVTPSPGGVIDTVLSVRASGLVIVLLLAVVWILSLCVVLLVFRSGFRLKRLAFSNQQETPTGHGSLLGSGIRSSGLYPLERDVFTAAGLPGPREFPLDLAVTAGMLILPLTIATDLLITATHLRLDFATTATLAAVALGLIAAVFLRLQWLVRAWRSRIGLKVIEPRERWLPDGSTVLVHGGAYGAVLLATGYVVWVVVMAATPYLSISEWVLFQLFLAPLLTWPLGMLWWYRLHRELAADGRCVSLRLVRAPILSLVPLLCLAGFEIIFAVGSPEGPSGFTSAVCAVLVCLGLVGLPVSIYRMGRSLEQLRLHAVPHTRWKARAAGLRAAAMFIVPIVAMLYFQHSLNRISREIGAPAQRTAPVARAGMRAVIAATLLAIGVACGIAGLFPGYLGGVSLAQQPAELVPHVIYFGAWGASALLILLGGARVRVGALLATGMTIVTFGLFFTDTGTAIAAGANLVGAGLVLALVGWLACAAGSVVAFRFRPAGSAGRLVMLGRPRGSDLGPVVILVLAGLGLAASFAPSWDSYTLRLASGRTESITAGNAFAYPAPVIAGQVAVMVAFAAVVIVAGLWRPICFGAVLLAGAIIPMAAQAISALVQAGEATSLSQLGNSPRQATAVLSSGLTPAFWVYCAFVIVLLLTCAGIFIASASPALAPAGPPPARTAVNSEPPPRQDAAATLARRRRRPRTTATAEAGLARQRRQRR